MTERWWERFWSAVESRRESARWSERDAAEADMRLADDGCPLAGEGL